MPSPRVQRSDLVKIPGMTESVMRYLEGLSQRIDDATPLSGIGVPNGVVKANNSRQYIDLSTNVLWINTDPDSGQSTGWVAI